MSPLDSMNSPTIVIDQLPGYWRGRFKAMASPCEILMDVKTKPDAEALTLLAQQEALRIEKKFSRYLKDNIIYQINHSQNQAIEVDQETAGLLDYAAQCYALSNGSFDITSGILRKVWKFDGSNNIPSKKSVNTLLKKIGWDKIGWNTRLATERKISLPKGMEIDLGGIGKEYAVDRSAQILKQNTNASLLINFGGDLYANKPRSNGDAWIIGVEDPQQKNKLKIKSKEMKNLQDYDLSSGGVATSGDAFRFLLKNGIRYSHILDPRTGWPVRQAPRSVTVAAATCTEAGILATLAMLQGKQAESFLDEQGVMNWCIR